MPTRKKKRKPRFTTARNDRKTVYQYFPQDEVHSVSVKGGRCKQCNHITALTCDDCMQFYCENHTAHDCKPKKIDYAL